MCVQAVESFYILLYLFFFFVFFYSPHDSNESGVFYVSPLVFRHFQRCRCGNQDNRATTKSENCLSHCH